MKSSEQPVRKSIDPKRDNKSGRSVEIAITSDRPNSNSSDIEHQVNKIRDIIKEIHDESKHRSRSKNRDTEQQRTLSDAGMPSI
jgi:hypothetical protein